MPKNKTELEYIDIWDIYFKSQFYFYANFIHFQSIPILDYFTFEYKLNSISNW